jgi:hypothetical protein
VREGVGVLDGVGVQVAVGKGALVAGETLDGTAVGEFPSVAECCGVQVGAIVLAMVAVGVVPGGSVAEAVAVGTRAVTV